MKILHIIILDRLHEKYGGDEIPLRDIRSNLKIVNRIPKGIVDMVIAEMIEKKFLIKTRKLKYRLRSNIGELIEQNMKKHQLRRNRVFS